MSPEPDRASVRTFARVPSWAWLALLAVVVSFGIFLPEANVGLNLSDEGYLWYGVRAIKAGQVPVRDFQAYDPGRYYWVTACSFLFGDGLVGMRTGCVLFECLGIFCALLVARRIQNDWKFLTIVGATLALWMNPQFKLFEQALGLIAVYVAVRLIERPTLRQHFYTGAAIGLMAFMGRNHGVYQVGAFGLLMLFLARGEWAKLPRRIVACGAGVAVGYLPQWLMFLFVKGYFHAFVASDLTAGSGIPLAVPWPWRIPATVPGFGRVCLFAEGLFFVALTAFVIVAPFWMWRLGRARMNDYRVFFAGACVSIFYAHHSFWRPEWVHLAHSVPTMIVALIAVGGACGLRSPRWLPMATALALLVVTLPARALHLGFVNEVLLPAGAFCEGQIGGQKMHVPIYFAGVLSTADRVANDLAKPDEPVLFLPHWPGLYPFTNRLSPLSQIYFMLPASPEQEQAMIEEMKAHRVKWVMLQDYKLDDRDDLRFRHTNPLMWEYFRTHFALVEIPKALPDTVVLRLREPAEGSAPAPTELTP